MRTLLLLRSAPAYSEAWTTGMVRAIAPDAVATFVGVPYAFPGPSFALERSGLLRKARRLAQGARLGVQQEALLALIHREKIERMFCNFLDLAVEMAPVWRRTDVPLFVHAHGFDVTFDMRDAVQPSRPIHTAEYLETAREIGRRGTIVANSHATKRLLLEAGFEEPSVAVCHLGVRLSDAPKRHATGDPARIFAVGRLVDFKAPDRTVRASHEALASHPEGRLDLFGDGPLRSAVELVRARLPQPERVVVHGSAPHERVQDSLWSASVFTQHNVVGEVSRQQEAFGVSLLEAGALGLPVVGTRSGGIVETVVEGETGLLVAPGDEAGQAQAIAALLDDPGMRNRLGTAAYEHVRERFSLDAWRDRMQSVLNR